MAEATHSNALDLASLQRYVDGNDELHEALGVARATPLPLRPFAQGEYNVNFAFEAPPASAHGTPEPLLLRVNLGSQMHLANQIGYEFAALEALAPSGRTPLPRYVDGSRTRIPFGIGVERRLPGRPLRYETDLPEAARILADVHATHVVTGTFEGPQAAHPPLVAPAHPVSDIERECEEMYAVYQGWEQADPAVLARVARLVQRAREIAQKDAARPAPPRRHVVNTELNSSNFLIVDPPGAGKQPGAAGKDDDGSAPSANAGGSGFGYLVDWEKPILGEVEQDLAHFLVPTTTFWKTDTILTRAGMDAFVGLYERAVGGRFDTSGVRARLDDYLAVTCLRGLTWCAMAMVEYSRPDRPVANADTFAKIKAYLTPDFLDFIARDYYGL